MPDRQNIGPHYIIIVVANKCSENVAQSKYLGTALTNESFVHEEVKRLRNSQDACYLSVQNLFSSCCYLKS
jgi:ribosomal protein S2